MKDLIAQLISESEARIEKVGRFKDPSEFAKPRKSKANCSICREPVYGNIDPTKIITCGYCVICLMAMDRDLKIWYRDKLLEAGHLEAARSIESFITEEKIDGNLRPIAERKGTGKESRNINRRTIGVQKARLPMGKTG